MRWNVRDPVLVIGAGPSGLAAARAFVRDGVAFEVVERHDDVGGIWDIDNPGTPMYESAHLISSKTMSALEGLPFPDEYPDYPRHEQLLAYLRSYADHFDLRQHIRFGTEVAEAAPLGPDGPWQVTFGDGTQGTYRALVLATGNQWHRNLPSYPGRWTGDSFHSREYRSPDDFRDKRVLIVGAGNSGCDIACDAARSAGFAAISMRRGYWFVPKYLMGKPSDVFAGEGPQLPAPVQQRVFEKLVQLTVGNPSRYGLPEPDHRILETHPIMNTELLHRAGHGDIQVRPDIERLEDDHVRFVDGTVEPFDLIVWATGYRPRFPMIGDELFTWRGPRDGDGNVTDRWAPDLFLNVFHRDRDDLFVMGMIETDASAWPHISLQADLIAAWLQVAERSPDQAAAFRRLRATEADMEGGLRHVESPRHSYYQRNATSLALEGEALRQLREGDVTGEPLQVGAVARITRSVRRLLPV